MNTSLQFNDKYGKWALVTGATSGIGQQLARQIAAKGVNILQVARQEAALEKNKKALQSEYGVEARSIPADLSDSAGIDSVIQAVAGFDVGLLVIAAGLEVNGAFEKTNLEKELKLLQLNVVATLRLAHHFIPSMVEKGRGGLLMVASLSGHMPNPYFANYAGSKAYVLNFGASLYGELKPKGVDVAVLSPGLTNTPMVADNGVDWSKTPMTPMAPEEVARVGLNALGKSFLAVPGGKNKVMAAMAKHSPLQMQAGMNEKMMRKAINPDRI